MCRTIMFIRNNLKRAFEEKKNELVLTVQPEKIAKSLLECSFKNTQWKNNISASQTPGDKTYMEDSIDVNFIPGWNSADNIKELSTILYLSMQFLGDLLFFYDTGSTLVCALHYKDMCLIGNLGDSKALLIREKLNQRKIFRLNQSHRRGNHYENTRIEKEKRRWGAKNLEYTFVYRGLGGFNYCPLICYEPEISYFRLNHDTINYKILLCSDGVTDALNEAELAFLISNNESITPNIINNFAYNAFKYLNKEADNISSILYTPHYSDTEITVACVADGVGNSIVAGLSTKLLAKLINPSILSISEEFVPWRELYNNFSSKISNDNILVMKEYSKTIIDQFLNSNRTIDILINDWLEKKKELCNQIAINSQNETI